MKQVLLTAPESRGNVRPSWLVVCRHSAQFNLRQAEVVRQQFRRWAPPHWDFKCYTDRPSEDWHVPLQTDWPGWWAIMETFRSSGPHVLTGLDTVLVGDVRPILALAERCPADELWGIRDFFRPKKWASGVTIWNGDWSKLSDLTPEFMSSHRGNQELTRWLVKSGKVPGKLRYLQDHMDGIVSYKRDIRGKLPAPPEGTRICCFHGRPRPWDVMDQETWLREHGFDKHLRPTPVPLWQKALITVSVLGASAALFWWMY